MVPADQLHREIEERIAGGEELKQRLIDNEAALTAQRHDYYTWSEYNEALLLRSFHLPGLAEEYKGRLGFAAFGGAPESLSVRSQRLQDDIAGKIRRLRSIQERLELFRMHPNATPAQSIPGPAVIGEDIFIVHGHDGATKTTVARFLQKLVGREPIILHEQADRGRTIIEKFEHHAASTACAVVLLTADDEGGIRGADDRLPRARQNVVFELGFFLASLAEIGSSSSMSSPSSCRAT